MQNKFSELIKNINNLKENENPHFNKRVKILKMKVSDLDLDKNYDEETVSFLYDQWLTEYYELIGFKISKMSH